MWKWGGQMYTWPPSKKNWGAMAPLAPPVPTPMLIYMHLLYTKVQHIRYV